jgi:hypothetical protein
MFANRVPALDETVGVGTAPVDSAKLGCDV